MKSAFLALITAGALFASTATAEARPPNRNLPSGVIVYPSVNTSPYYGYSPYYNYSPYYYPANNGLFFNVGNFALSVGNGYSYPTYYYDNYYYPRSYYGNGYYYSRPYYGNSYYYGGRWYRNW